MISFFPAGLAEVVKEWGGFVGVSRFKSRWRQKITFTHLYNMRSIYFLLVNLIAEYWLHEFLVNSP